MEEQLSSGNAGGHRFKGDTLGKVVFISMVTLAQGYAGGIIATTIGQPSFQKYMGKQFAYQNCVQTLTGYVARTRYFSTHEPVPWRDERVVLCWRLPRMHPICLDCKSVGA